MKVTLVVPTLNELEGLKKTMPLIKKEWVNQVVVLDGRSTDGSVEWAREQGYGTWTESESGLWAGYSEMFLIGKVKGDIVITFSPDGNSIPEIIPELVKKINEGYDMVIASRYKDGATSEDDTKLTGFGNKMLTGLVNLLSGYKYTDSLVMYRAYRTDIVWQLGLTETPNWLQRRLMKLSGLYSWEPSLSIRAAKAHLRIAEIPASEPLAFRERRQNTFVHGITLLTQILHEALR